MWRRVAILIVCGLAVIVAVWTSATPAAERFPDPTGALQAPETCHPLETGNPRTFEELTALANIEFWNLQPEPMTVNDGSTWTLEGRAAGRYHLVWRQSPPDSPFRRVALDLLRLGGIRRP